jgi:hypothetical protein
MRTFAPPFEFFSPFAIVGGKPEEELAHLCTFRRIGDSAGLSLLAEAVFGVIEPG